MGSKKDLNGKETPWEGEGRGGHELRILWGKSQGVRTCWTVGAQEEGRTAQG